MMMKKLIYSFLILLCVCAVSCSKDDETPVAGQGDAVSLTIDGKQMKLFVEKALYDTGSDDFSLILSETLDEEDEDAFRIYSFLSFPLEKGTDVGKDVECEKEWSYTISSGYVRVGGVDETNRILELELDGVWKSRNDQMLTIKGTVKINYKKDLVLSSPPIDIP